MASLSVDEKDWLQEQIRTACESSTRATMEKKWGHFSNAPKQCDLAKLEREGTMMKYQAAQIERMQYQIIFEISYINNHD
jgi:hypothetical protein